MKKLLPILLYFALSPSVYAGFEGSITLASDYRLYGFSQTLEDPALMVDVSYSHDSGFFVGAFAANVDFVEDSDPNDLDADIEYDLFLGYEFAINEENSMAFTVVTYKYPGTNVDLDYVEYVVDYISPIGDFTVGYSNDAFALDEKGIRYEYAYSFDVNENVSVGVMIGRYDLDDALNESYTYYDLGITIPWEMVEFTFSYSGSNVTGEELFGDVADGRFAVAATYSF